MSIQINTESLTSPWSFVKQSWKILWEHKGWYFAFAALPIIVSILPSFYGMDTVLSTSTSENIEQLLSPAYFNSYAGLFFISPLLYLAWSNYLLNPEYKPSLGSYLTFDKRYFKYVLYGILMGLFYVVSISIIILLMSILGLFTPSSMPTLPLIAAILVAVNALVGMLYVLMPLNLIFPAISLGAKVTFIKILKEGKIYRKSFFLSLILSFLVCIAIYLLLLALCALIGFIGGWLGISLFSDHNSVMQFIKIFIGALMVIAFSIITSSIFTLYALYYKKYLAE